MKRFTVVTALFGVSILAVWMVSQAFAVSPANTKDDNAPIQVQDVTGHEAPIPVTGAEARNVAPVFDTTGAIVSDPTGTILGGIHSANVKIAPIFDTTGAVVSDPTGTILGAVHSGNKAIPVTGADMKIAPVFDATGGLVSDPTGTIWSALNP
jgi:hypothetical protein